MNERPAPISEIRKIIAADQRCGEVNPSNDQVWEFNTNRGEPPGIALQTTYGLRAYGIRIYPKFVQNKIPVSDPRTFAVRPVVGFSAPNFLSLEYSPFHPIDVIQKVWVPNSNTLVGQITLSNTSATMIQFEMEWVVLLNPLTIGSSMTSSQISVNTILQGQSQHLFPVFFLTGGPRASLSGLPSLGIELSLPPQASRQFSWALATLESTDSSFFNARKSTAYSLDNEQIKLMMLQRQQSFEFEFQDTRQGDSLKEAQQRAFQLLMPPWHEFNHHSYITTRLPDQGYILPESSNDFYPAYGIQQITELFELSRVLLPARPDLIKEMFHNFLEQQENDGTIPTQSSWNGTITRLPTAPLLVSLALDIFESNDDLDWLKLIYPALFRSIRVWFNTQNDEDADGYPEWRHLLQTGITESIPLNQHKRVILDTLVKTAEWPSLAAMLIKECRGLIRIAKLIQDDAEIAWLDEQVNQLDLNIKESWNDRLGFYLFREKTTHANSKGITLHIFRQDGSSEVNIKLVNPSRLCLIMRSKDGEMRSLECKIKGIVNHHEKTVSLSSNRFQWEDENALVVTDEIFSAVKQITITGLKKSDQLSIETPDFTFKGPDFLIPLWAGIPSIDQVELMIQQSSKLLEEDGSGLPLFLKIMWIEGLVRYDHQELACRFFQTWFLDTVLESSHYPIRSIHELLPIKTLLMLLGIQNITDREIILKDYNDFFPKVNVQYKKFEFVLEAAQTRMKELNGESVLIAEPGTHRIVLS